MELMEDIVLIAGPTASGKTGLAIKLAQASNGVIINTDSMQVYRDLKVLTARPSDVEEAAAEHVLFGHVDAVSAYSVAHWLDEVEPLLNLNVSQGRKLIFVGGTGLYFNSLINGISPMPDIKKDIREKWRLSDDKSSVELHGALADRDPSASSVLNPHDRQRIIRALEVFESTGRSIVDWQRQEGRSILPSGVLTKKILLMPDRGILHERINSRFEGMVSSGAMKEVEALLGRNLDPALPAMKAIGVPQLSAFLSGKETLDDAMEKAKAATRQYAKRQSTWFRNSFDDDWEMTIA